MSDEQQPSEEVVAEAVEADTDTHAEEVQQAGDEAGGEPDLEAQLIAAQQKAEENWDTAMRVKAEMENLKKRTARDIEKAHKFALEGFMGEILPIRDSVELGISAASDENVEIEKLREGMELTLKALESACGKFGLSEVNPVDEAFDPELHQAMTMLEMEGVESGKIVEVIQKGFLLNERLLRPAMVVVAK